MNTHSQKDKSNNSIFIRILIVLSILLVLFSILLPFLISKSPAFKELDALNEVGDAMGGIMNPFIAIAAVIVTGLAFWAQYQANEVVKNQFGMQQFENHVYKLADIYRDNVARWGKLDKKYGLVFTDRLVAISVLEAYDTLYSEMTMFIKYWKDIKKEEVEKPEYLSSLKEIIEPNDKLGINDNFYNNWIQSEICYLIIFFGVEDRGRMNIVTQFKEYYVEEFLKAVVFFFSYKITEKKDKKLIPLFKLRIESNNPNGKLSNNDYDRINGNHFDKNIIHPYRDEENFFKFYNGTESLFAHHYRHLHSAYKFINDFVNLKYQIRWKVHAKLIRTQMSNAEQILFFLNSICILGRGWELEHIINRKNLNSDKLNKRLVTKYDIIKNIPKGDRGRYYIEKFYPDIEWEDIPMTEDNKKAGEVYENRSIFEKLYT